MTMLNRNLRSAALTFIFSTLLFLSLLGRFPILGSLVLRNVVAVHLLNQTAQITESPLGAACGSAPNVRVMENFAQVSVDWDPQDSAAWRMFGRLLWLEGQCPEALAAWQKAAELGGARDNLSRFDLACGLFETGERARAVTEFSNIGAGNYLYNIAAAEWKLGRRDSAQMLYELALDIKPMFPQAITLAQIYLDEGNSGRAAQVWLNLAQSLDSNNPDHWFSLGQVALLNQDWEAARDAFQSGIAVSKEPFNLYLQLGDALGKLKDWNGATTAYEQAIKLDPKGSLWPYYALGNIALAQGQYEVALDWYYRSRIVNPHSEAADYWAGLAALQTNQLSEADLRLNAALRINPQNADVLAALAKLRQTQGDLAGAIQYGVQSSQQYYAIGQLSNYCSELSLLKGWYANLGELENTARVELEQTRVCTH